MKYKLYRNIQETIQIQTQKNWNIEKVELEGDKLIEFLRPNLIMVMKEVLDPDTAGKKPDGYLRNLQSGRLGDFSKRYIISAIDDDKVIGLLIALPDKDDILHIYTIGVVKEYRQQGVATSMIKRCIDDFKHSSFKQVLLDVHDVNKPALELYKKIGFTK